MYSTYILKLMLSILVHELIFLDALAKLNIDLAITFVRCEGLASLYGSGISIGSLPLLLTVLVRRSRTLVLELSSVTMAFRVSFLLQL